MALNPLNGASAQTVQNRFYGVNSLSDQTGNTNQMYPGSTANRMPTPARNMNNGGITQQVTHPILSTAEHIGNPTFQPAIRMSPSSGGRNAEFGLGQQSGRNQDASTANNTEESTVSREQPL